MANDGLPGRAGASRRITQEWVGWTGRVAHPDSPLGGGGPGFFAGDSSGLQQRDAPGHDGPVRLDDGTAEEKPADKPKPANPPPSTSARSLGSQKSVQSDFIDVEIDAEVLDDSSGGPSNGAETDFVVPPVKALAYDSENGKVTKFKGKLTWRGTLKIQTSYGDGASPTTLSCYGRGTTSADLENRDITLGFHESRHQADFIAYLASHPLPDPPTLTLGMAATDYEAAAAKFSKAVVDYRKDMKAQSDKVTDEVGHKRSEVNAKGCYMHLLP